MRDRTLVLRILVPGLEARLRDKMKEMEESAKNENRKGDKETVLDLEGVSCEPTGLKNLTLWNFHCDGATYPAKLVNLPCPVEILKTHDHAYYYKCVDVAQMLIVYEDEMALEEAEQEKPVEGFPSYYHSGLTPPMQNVVSRRFANRDHLPLAPPRSSVSYVEDELIDRVNRILDSGKGKRNAKTASAKVLEEVEEEIVDYEPWMDDYGKAPQGITFEVGDSTAAAHPEIWLSSEKIRELREREQKKESSSSSSKKTPGFSMTESSSNPEFNLAEADKLDLDNDFLDDLDLDGENDKVLSDLMG